MLEEHLEKQNEQLNNLLLDVVKNQKRSYKSLVTVFIVTVISLTLIICTMIFSFIWYESQFEITEETKAEITQTVDGENSSINNVTGNQYNDNAIHNQGK